MSKLAFATVLAASMLAACKSGPGPEVRTAIGAKLESAQPQIQQCYQTSLTTNRKLRGMLNLSMQVTEQGEFTNIVPRRDEPADPVLRFCVVKAIAALKLDKPPGAKIDLESVPIKFEWANP